MMLVVEVDISKIVVAQQQKAAWSIPLLAQTCTAYTYSEFNMVNVHVYPVNSRALLIA